MKNYADQYHGINSLLKRMNTLLPEQTKSFFEFNKASMKSSVLSEKVKELICLAISICIRCDDCLVYHMHKAIELGASKEEILDIIGLSVVMGGGPALMESCQAIVALEQLWTDDKEYIDEMYS